MRYGLQFRPPAPGAIPNEPFTLLPPLDAQEGQRRTRHGVIEFGRRLSDAEVQSFELVLLADGDERASLADEVAADMSEYAEAYLEEWAESAENFRAMVMHRLARCRPYAVYAGEASEFVDLVVKRLRQAAAQGEVQC